MAREQILQGLLQRGFPAHVAQGIIGNIAVESGFDPSINEIAPLVPGSRGGFGLFQHTGPRRRALEAFASQTGRPLADIDTQLDFVVQELGTTEKAAADALKGAKTTEEAARIFSEKFLRPGIPHLDQRIAAATGAESVAADTMFALGKSPQMTLLGSEGNDNMAEQPQGLLGGTKLGNFLTPDRRDHLIAALEGMTLNPNQALIQAAGGRIQQRQQDRAQAQQANRTVEFLRARGREDLIELARMDPRAAIQAALAPQQADNVVVNNRLVNRQTGEVVADFSAAEAAEDVPTAVKSLQIRAEAGGLKPGTPEYQEFMLRGGANKGIALQVGPDGTVSFAQGGAELKPLTETQSKSATFAVRAEGALPILDQNDTALTSRAQRAAEFDPTGLARELQTPEFQAAKQAGDEFLQAILRKDTGAAITKQEQDLYGKTYLPQPGDSEEQILQKRQSRRRALEALKAGMSADAILAQEQALERSGDTPQPPAGAATHRFNPETGEIEEIK